MREIKFRAWDKSKKKIVDVVMIDFSKNISMVELMQFTGLYDKNGKEIYEGDIVETPFGIGRVFDRLGCWFVETQKELGYFASCDLEVIGNLYENPELLEVKE